MTALVPPLSPVRVHGDLVLVSGQVGLEADGRVPGGFDRQMRRAVDALRAVLEGAGSSLEAVLKTTVVIVRTEDFAAMNALYAELFSPPWPARTTLVAGLALPGLLFEIEATAALPGAPLSTSRRS